MDVTDVGVHFNIFIIHVSCIGFLSGYTDKLMTMLCDTAISNPSEYSSIFNSLNIPSFRSSNCKRPDIEEAVAAYTTRFNLPVV